MLEKKDPLVEKADFFDETFFNKIVEQVYDMILVLDVYGKVLYANHAAVNVYGYSHVEFHDIRLHDLCPPETKYNVDSQLEMAYQKSLFFRSVHIRRNGKAFPVEVNSRRVSFAQGEVVINIIRDISGTVAIETALKKSEEKYRILHEDLTAVHEELTTFKEELRRQYEALRISEEEYRTIFEAAADGIYVHDLVTGKVLDVNEKACESNGYTREEILSGNYQVIGRAGPPYDETEALRLIKLAANGEPQLFEWKDKHNHGRDLIWEEVSLKRVMIGRDERVLAIVRDISERKKTEFELHKSQVRNQALIDAIPDVLFIVRDDGVIINYKESKKRPRLLPNTIIGKSVSAIFPSALADQIKQDLKFTLETGDNQVFEYCVPFQGANEYYEIRGVIFGENEVLAICRNITNRKQTEEKLKYLSLHDSLTQLHNRAFFEEQVNQLQKARNRSAGLLICDVDGLKLVNDTLGHSVGDVLLQSVAKILRNSFRSEDIVARIGGDEFAVLLPTDSPTELAAGRKRILSQVKQYNANNPTVPISLSIGYAVSGRAPFSMDVLFKEADNNMYREKLRQQKSTRNSIVPALMKALEACDFLTEGHGERMQEMIQLFTEIIGLPENNIADLRLFAQFHDIGKVGIPASILYKSGSLTEEEWVVMRQHCEIGYRIAVSTPDLSPIANWILKHQEWWNGSGYPFGLQEEAIPLACRILAILDAYDAMTNDRPYRQAISNKAAIEELKRYAGIQFDPVLVEQFVSLLKSD